jgi:hypothetical protein
MLPDIINNEAKLDPSYMQILDSYQMEKADKEKLRIENDDIEKHMKPIKMIK